MAIVVIVRRIIFKLGTKLHLKLTLLFYIFIHAKVHWYAKYLDMIQTALFTVVIFGLSRRADLMLQRYPFVIYVSNDVFFFRKVGGESVKSVINKAPVPNAQ